MFELIVDPPEQPIHQEPIRLNWLTVIIDQIELKKMQRLAKILIEINENYRCWTYSDKYASNRFKGIEES